MREMFRHCRDCGAEQLFMQLHADCCPDAADGDCAEWFCVDCGSALLIGIVPQAAGSRWQAGLRGRVA